MTSMFVRLPSKTTPVRRPSLAPKSTCRSPNCRLNSTSSRPTKTRRLRNNTSHNFLRARHQGAQPPLCRTCPVRCNYNKLNLLTTSRPKSPNRLLLRKPHRTSNCSNSNPNFLKLFRSHNSYNFSRPDILRPILPSQHKL